MATPVQTAVERRPTLFLILVLGFLFVLMSFNRRTQVIGETRTLAERAVMTVFSPVPKAVNAVGRSASDLFHGYLDMRQAVQENVQLRQRLADLTREYLALKRSHADLARMRALLGYTAQLDMPTILGQIMMLDTSGLFKSAIIDRGADDGIEVNDVAVNAAGLVGRVVLTTNDMAKIQLVIDSGSSVGAIVERSRRQGVIRGDGKGQLRLLYIPELADIQPGDLVLTAGTDGIFPKGVPIARVVSVEEGTDLFKTILCQPTVDFGTLEQVILIHTRKIPPEVVRYTP